MPTCAARTERWTISPEYVDRYCTSGYHSRCPRFAAPVVSEGSAPSPASATNLTRRLLYSAAWVVGIPTAIVFLIMLAAWLTEHVFLVTALFDTPDDVQTWLR
jgi:hypothetical protein